MHKTSTLSQKYSSGNGLRSSMFPKGSSRITYVVVKAVTNTVHCGTGQETSGLWKGHFASMPGQQCTEKDDCTVQALNFGRAPRLT